MSKPDFSASSASFREGERVQLTNAKGRRNTVTLESGSAFHSHKGTIFHDNIIGLPDGSVIENNIGESYLALKPLLSDFVMSMPRGAAIVYPKDAAQIISMADIFPGAKVVEAGVGSGSLSLHLLRALGGYGMLHSFERRSEFADIAQANVRAFHGSNPTNWQLHLGDLSETLNEVVEDASIDRVVLDMLAPWECVESVSRALKPGGVLICYVATVTQLSRLVEKIRESGNYNHTEASETMVRGWHVEGLAVRPDHRMVAHTGFLVTTRRLAPGAVLPQPKRRSSKSDYSDEDVAVWVPEMIGDTSKSDKILRKKARQAQSIADARQDEQPKTDGS